MSVQIINCALGVRRVEAASYDAHGAPVFGTPAALSELLPGKRSEQPSGEWILALDPTLWPVRVHDHVIADDGQQWMVVDSKFIPMPPLAPEEVLAGIDLDISFIRVTADQITTLGTEPGGEVQGGIFVGRGDNPETEALGVQPLGTSPLGRIIQ